MVSSWLRLRPGASAACRCVSCISRTAVNRPAGAPAKSSSRLTILFYSSIISTAAAADSAAKTRRRDQLDAKISELEQELCPDSRRIAIAHESDDPLPGQDITGVLDTSWLHAQRRDGTGRLPMHFGRQITTPLASARLDYGHSRPFPDIEVPQHASVTGKEIASGASSSHPRNGQAISSWTNKKLLTVEHSVAKLATRFMLASRRTRRRRATRLHSALQDLQWRLDRIKDLSNIDSQAVPNLQYPRYEVDSTPSTCDHQRSNLNKAISDLCRRAMLGTLSLSSLLYRISYNLLVSPVAPDIITYTLLITRLDRLGCPDWAEMVIDSLRETHLRPNVVSATAVLDHYARYRKPEDFHRSVLQLQGYYGGPMLARPGNHAHKPGQSILHPSNGKSIQLLELDQRLYHRIISGYEAFGYHKSALEWTHIMQEAGFRIDLPTLNNRLRHQASRGTWPTGTQIWTEIRRRLDTSDDNVIRREDTRIAYYWMLRLCRKFGKMDEHDRIQSEGFNQGFSENDLSRLKPQAPQSPYHFDVQRLRRSKVALLGKRAQRIIDEVRSIQVLALASSLSITGGTLSDVKNIFSSHGQEERFNRWLSESPWLRPEESTDHLDLISAAQGRNRRRGFRRLTLGTNVASSDTLSTVASSITTNCDELAAAKSPDRERSTAETAPRPQEERQTIDSPPMKRSPAPRRFPSVPQLQRWPFSFDYEVPQTAPSAALLAG